MKQFLTIVAMATAVLLSLNSCSNVEEQAQLKLEEARQALQNQDFDRAKALIDSIKIQFPKAYDTRHESLRLLEDVDLRQKQVLVDSLNQAIQLIQQDIDTAAKGLVLEKDAEYQQTGNYLAPSQVVEKTLHRTFLRFQVDETGKLSMTSIYCGSSNIHHTAVKVTAPDGSSAQTSPSRDSYETTDMGEHIEKADYSVDEDGGVIDFICQHKDEALKVTFLGDRNHNATMLATDRQAAYDVRELAKLLTAKTEANQVLEEAQLRIRFVEKKISERGTSASEE